MKHGPSTGRLARLLVFASLIIALVGVSSCASGRIPFTQHLRNRYGLEEGEISSSHKLVQKEEGVVEEVFIAAGTPGIAMEVGPTSLAVSFEPGRSLNFGSPPDDWDSERLYTLSARRWTDYYGELSYDGKMYHAVKGSGHVYLEVRAESLDTMKKKKKVLPGMTLPAK